MKRSLLIFIFIFHASQIFSQFLDENFSYPAGDSIGAHGWTWVNGVTNTVFVTSPGLNYSGYALSGIGNAVSLTTTGNDYYKDFFGTVDSINPGTVYASFMVNVSSAQFQGDYFIAFLPSNSTMFYAGRVSARFRNSNLEFGLTKASQPDTNTMQWVGGYNLNTTYLLVLKYRFIPGSFNDEVSLFVFNSGFPITEPSPTIGPSSFSATSFDESDIGRIALRQGVSTRAPVVKVDGIRVTPEWFSVPPIVPTNIYTLGKIPFPWGLSDTLVDKPFYDNPNALFRSFKTGIRLKKIASGAQLVTLRVKLRNRESPFDTRLDSTYQFLINSDSVVNIRLPGFNKPRRDLVIVQALPGEADGMDLPPIADSLVYCVDFTSDSYNHADPCLLDTNGTGFNGSTGNLVAGFSNDDASSFFVYAVDHSFYDSTAGKKPYKIVIYGDDGSGKPGALLYISPPDTSPPGISAPRLVTHEINPPIIIPGYSKFFVGYKQTSTANIKASYQNEIPIREKSFFFSTPEASAVWFDFSDSSKNFRLDISPRTSLRLFLKAYLEGFYNGVTMIPDTANVVVRNFNSPYGLIEQDAAILNSSGMGIFDFRKLNRSTGYFFVVSHRNHLETWSRNTPEIFNVFDKSYNFTDSISKAYGNNMKNILGKFVLYSGDVNQDGTVDATDLALIDNDAANFATGYLNTDLTGDNQVDGTDLAIADNNASNFVSVVRP